jgi:uncharacterized membrane protein YkoI
MMKTLLVVLLCNCLLVPMASGQSFAQKMSQFGDQFRKHSQGQNDRGQNDRGQSDKLQNGFASPADETPQSSISRRDANDLARDAYPGKVVSIRREGDHWRVRMDEGGTVFNVLVNADSGTVNRPSE